MQQCDKCLNQSDKFVLIKIAYKGGKEITVFLCQEHANELASYINKWIHEP